MIMPDAATFAMEADALRLLHSTTAKAVNGVGRRTCRDALKARLDRPIGGVTPKMIYGAGIAAEILNNQAQRAALEARGDAVLPVVDPLDTTPCGLVLVQPEKPDPARARMLIELGLTLHTDARRTRGIASYRGPGPWIVTPLVEAVRGQVITISLPPPNDAESDTSGADAPADSPNRHEVEAHPSGTVARRRERLRAVQKPAAQSDATSAPVVSILAETAEGDRLRQNDVAPIMTDDDVETASVESAPRWFLSSRSSARRLRGHRSGWRTRRPRSRTRRGVATTPTSRSSCATAQNLGLSKSDEIANRCGRDAPTAAPRSYRPCRTSLPCA